MVVCPECSASVSAEHLSTELGVGACPSCSETFDLSRAAVHTEGSGKTAGEGWELSIPPGMELARTKASLVLTFSWPTGMGAKIAFVGVAGCAVLATVSGAQGTTGGGVGAALAVVMLGFVAYIAAAFFLNTTTVIVHEGTLAVEHGPLPWPGGIELRVSNLVQLFVRRVETRGGKSGQKHISYALVAKTRGREITLAANFQDAESAQFIERAIEEHLGIDDRVMPEEYR